MTPEECLFCRIARGEIPSEQTAQSSSHIAMRDINPAAPTHVLVVPRTHHATFDEWIADGAPDSAETMAFIGEVAETLGITGNYRLEVNVGADAGQEIFHVHWHMLSQKAT